MQTRVHINLNVNNLEGSIAFYRTLFGQEPSKRREDYANWRLDAPALHLALVSQPGAKVADSHARHFGVELFEDAELEGWRKRVQKAGLSVRTEEQVTCCYAVADKFWATDPDGNEWEFWVRHEDAETMHEEPGACCGASAAENAKAKAAGSCCAAGASSQRTTQGENSCC